MKASPGSHRAVGFEDPQVITALKSIGHDPFPFSAFDTAGRLTVPPKVTADLKRQLDEVLRAPDWKRVFSTISIFDNVGHHSSQLGFRFDNHGISIVAVRSVQSLRTPEAGGGWYSALTETLLETVQKDAGKAYYMKPSWIDAIRQILGLIGRDSDGASVKDSDRIALFDLQLALEFVLGILEVANLFGRSHAVSCAVVWQYPYFFPRLTPEGTRKWAPLGRVSRMGGRSAAGILWDQLNRTTWTWVKDAPWSAMPVQPAKLHRAWFPSGSASLATGAGTPVGAAPPAHGKQTGLASWYGCRGMYGAHKSLPIGTRVLVKNPANGRTVRVTINNRGPFFPGRIIDLCKSAFAAISPLSSGVVPVAIEW